MKSVQITLYGRTFTIQTSDPEGSVQAAADLCNARAVELSGPRSPAPQNLAMLVALNLANELLEERARHRALKEAIRLRGSALLEKLRVRNEN